MPPQSRGPSLPSGFQSKSTPNLSTANALGITDAAESPSLEPLHRTFSPSEGTTPSEPASLEDSIEDPDLNGDFLSSESDSSEDDILAPHSTDQGPGHRRWYSGQSSRSHTHLPPSTTSLFPPFYNRPPTPLPPSPSLTSLLRPSFSTQTSHPTTPETSDTESHVGALGANGNASSTTAPSSLRKWTTSDPVARASPKIPTYEYYGFALYLASSIAFIMILLWAYLPSPFLHQLGIYYFPDRWWALAVPAWLVVGVVWIYVALGSYNSGHLTLPMESTECMVDECAYVAVIDGEGRIVKRRSELRGGHGRGQHDGAVVESRRKGKGKRQGHRRPDSRDSKKERDYGLLGKDVDRRRIWSEGTDAVMDVPIGGVCEILYGSGREEMYEHQHEIG